MPCVEVSQWHFVAVWLRVWPSLVVVFLASSEKLRRRRAAPLDEMRLHASVCVSLAFVQWQCFPTTGVDGEMDAHENAATELGPQLSPRITEKRSSGGAFTRVGVWTP